MAARSAVLLTVASLLAACGRDPAEVSATGSAAQALRSCTYSYSAWSACDATGTQTRTVTSKTPAKCTGTPVTTQSCTPEPTPAPNPCWTPPPDFYTALQVQVEAQPVYSGGYGGQITDPFPDLPGTTHFASIQIARATAMHLDSYFARCAFRFDVDGTTDMMQSNGYRAELEGENLTFLPGETYEIRFSTYFSDQYANASWTDWNMIGQFHSPNFAAWGIWTAGGYLLMRPPGATADLRVPMIARNMWHDFVWTVHFAKDSTGSAKLVVDGATLFDFHGQTFHTGESSYYPKYGSYLAQNRYRQVTYNTGWTVAKLP